MKTPFRPCLHLDDSSGPVRQYSFPLKYLQDGPALQFLDS